ncbi:MAG TPA: ABC transporter ATP-binding protein [Parafilimonas sp.]|nr:ABC transporter ATP-binding protein [Parafilimonas sp.]
MDNSRSVIVNNLTKNYGKKDEVKAVKGISFEVSKGELFGVIGPDGAGKTSLFRMLTTLLLPDGGNATVDGSDIVKDYKAIRNKVGYMPGRFSLYQDLSVEENLNFFATIFNTTVEKNYDLIKDIYIQIEPFKKRKAGKLSGGMKQKLALSCALIHRPVVLFLDEPTTGVDAVSRKEFWEMLKRLKEQNITILVSTPYMDEAGLCDRIGLMQQGKLLSVGIPKEITSSFKQKILAVKSNDMYALLKDLNAFDEIEDAYSFGEYHHAVMKENYNKDALQDYLKANGNSNLIIQNIQPTIEDSFMQLMKQ